MHSASIRKLLSVCLVLASPGTLLAGPRLYVADTLGDTVTVIDTATNERVGDPIITSHGRPLAPVVSADGSRVYVQSADGPIDVIDAATATVIDTFDDPNPDAPDGPGALTVSPGGMLYAIGAGQDSVAIIEPTLGTVFAHVTPDGPAIHVASMRVSHDGTRLYLMDSVDLSIKVVDVATFHTIGTVAIASAGTTDALMGMALSLDDRTLYAITFYGQLVRIDTGSLSITASDPIGVPDPVVVGSQLYGIALQPDGSRAFVAESGTACLLDVDLGASSAAAGTGIAANNACFSVAAGRDGKHAYVAAYDIASDAYSVVALDPADNAAAVSIDGFAYPNFDDQSIDRSGATLTPRAGLWWTPGLPGSSFEIEVQDGTIIVVASNYDDGGSPTWRMASGPFDAENGTFAGEFVRYEGGSCLGCPYRAPTGLAADGGSVSVAFSTATTGTLRVGGTTRPIAKYLW